MFIPGYFDKSHVQLVQNEIVRKFTIGDGPGKARFGAVTAHRNDDNVYFVLNKNSDAAGIERDMNAMADKAIDTDNFKTRGFLDGFHERTLKDVYPQLQTNALPRRKQFRVVFMPENYDRIYAMIENEKKEYNNNRHRNEATVQTIRGNELGITTLVACYDYCTPDIAMPMALNKREDVFPFGTREQMAESKQIQRIYERIKSDLKC